MIYVLDLYVNTSHTTTCKYQSVKVSSVSLLIDRPIILTNNLNNNRFHHKHCHVSYCKRVVKLITPR